MNRFSIGCCVKKVIVIVFISIFCFLLNEQTAIAQSQKTASAKGVILNSGGCASKCCSSRVSIFFFEDGNCVRRSIDETQDRITYFGTWKMEKSMIKIHYTTSFYGKPIGELIDDPNRCSGGWYRNSLYTAVKENISLHDSIDWNYVEKSWTSLDLITDSYPDPMYRYDVAQRTKIRADFSQFNFLTTDIRIDKQKIYSEQHLASLNKQELRLLRNEIYAKYGLEFKSEDLKKHFEKPLYYDGKYNDVTVFLNQCDLINIDLIKKFENM